MYYEDEAGLEALREMEQESPRPSSFVPNPLISPSFLSPDGFGGDPRAKKRLNFDSVSSPSLSGQGLGSLPDQVGPTPSLQIIDNDDFDADMVKLAEQAEKAKSTAAFVSVDPNLTPSFLDWTT